MQSVTGHNAGASSGSGGGKQGSGSGSGSGSGRPPLGGGGPRSTARSLVDTDVSAAAARMTAAAATTTAHPRTASGRHAAHAAASGGSFRSLPDGSMSARKSGRRHGMARQTLSRFWDTTHDMAAVRRVLTRLSWLMLVCALLAVGLSIAAHEVLQHANTAASHAMLDACRTAAGGPCLLSFRNDLSALPPVASVAGRTRSLPPPGGVLQPWQRNNHTNLPRFHDFHFPFDRDAGGGGTALRLGVTLVTLVHIAALAAYMWNEHIMHRLRGARHPHHGFIPSSHVLLGAIEIAVLAAHVPPGWEWLATTAAARAGMQLYAASPAWLPLVNATEISAAAAASVHGVAPADLTARLTWLPCQVYAPTFLTAASYVYLALFCLVFLRATTALVRWLYWISPLQSAGASFIITLTRARVDAWGAVRHALAVRPAVRLSLVMGTLVLTSAYLMYVMDTLLCVVVPTTANGSPCEPVGFSGALWTVILTVATIGYGQPSNPATPASKVVAVLAATLSLLLLVFATRNFMRWLQLTPHEAMVVDKLQSIRLQARVRAAAVAAVVAYWRYRRSMPAAATWYKGIGLRGVRKAPPPAATMSALHATDEKQGAGGKQQHEAAAAEALQHKHGEVTATSQRPTSAASRWCMLCKPCVCSRVFPFCRHRDARAGSGGACDESGTQLHDASGSAAPTTSGTDTVIAVGGPSAPTVSASMDSAAAKRAKWADKSALRRRLNTNASSFPDTPTDILVSTRNLNVRPAGGDAGGGKGLPQNRSLVFNFASPAGATAGDSGSPLVLALPGTAMPSAQSVGQMSFAGTATPGLGFGGSSSSSVRMLGATGPAAASGRSDGSLRGGPSTLAAQQAGGTAVPSLGSWNRPATGGAVVGVRVPSTAGMRIRPSPLGLTSPSEGRLRPASGSQTTTLTGADRLSGVEYGRGDGSSSVVSAVVTTQRTEETVAAVNTSDASSALLFVPTSRSSHGQQQAARTGAPPVDTGSSVVSHGDGSESPTSHAASFATDDGAALLPGCTPSSPKRMFVEFSDHADVTAIGGARGEGGMGATPASGPPMLFTASTAGALGTPPRRVHRHINFSAPITPATEVANSSGSTVGATLPAAMLPPLPASGSFVGVAGGSSASPVPGRQAAVLRGRRHSSAMESARLLARVGLAVGSTPQQGGEPAGTPPDAARSGVHFGVGADVDRRPSARRVGTAGARHERDDASSDGGNSVHRDPGTFRSPFPSSRSMRLSFASPSQSPGGGPHAVGIVSPGAVEAGFHTSPPAPAAASARPTASGRQLLLGPAGASQAESSARTMATDTKTTPSMHARRLSMSGGGTQGAPLVSTSGVPGMGPLGAAPLPAAGSMRQRRASTGEVPSRMPSVAAVSNTPLPLALQQPLRAPGAGGTAPGGAASGPAPPPKTRVVGSSVFMIGDEGGRDAAAAEPLLAAVLAATIHAKDARARRRSSIAAAANLAGGVANSTSLPAVAEEEAIPPPPSIMEALRTIRGEDAARLRRRTAARSARTDPAVLRAELRRRGGGDSYLLGEEAMKDDAWRTDEDALPYTARGWLGYVLCSFGCRKRLASTVSDAVKRALRFRVRMVARPLSAREIPEVTSVYALHEYREARKALQRHNMDADPRNALSVHASALRVSLQQLEEMTAVLSARVALHRAPLSARVMLRRSAAAGSRRNMRAESARGIGGNVGACTRSPPPDAIAPVTVAATAPRERATVGASVNKQASRSYGSVLTLGDGTPNSLRDHGASYYSVDARTVASSSFYLDSHAAAAAGSAAASALAGSGMGASSVVAGDTTQRSAPRATHRGGAHTPDSSAVRAGPAATTATSVIDVTAAASAAALCAEGASEVQTDAGSSGASAQVGASGFSVLGAPVGAGGSEAHNATARDTVQTSAGISPDAASTVQQRWLPPDSARSASSVPAGYGGVGTSGRSLQTGTLLPCPDERDTRLLTSATTRTTTTLSEGSISVTSTPLPSVFSAGAPTFGCMGGAAVEPAAMPATSSSGLRIRAALSRDNGSTAADAASPPCTQAGCTAAHVVVGVKRSDAKREGKPLPSPVVAATAASLHDVVALLDRVAQQCHTLSAEASAFTLKVDAAAPAAKPSSAVLVSRA